MVPVYTLSAYSPNFGSFEGIIIGMLSSGLIKTFKISIYLSKFFMTIVFSSKIVFEFSSNTVEHHFGQHFEVF